MPGKSHAARYENSPRLQRVAAFLSQNSNRWVSTLEISVACERCAAHSDVHELRENGFVIQCRPRQGERGVYEYRLTGRPGRPVRSEGQMEIFDAAI